MAAIDQIKVGSTTYTINADRATKDGSGNTITSTYMPKSGGTFTGAVTMVGEKYAESSGGTAIDFTNCGLDMKNSDVVGCNSIYFQDACESGREGIQFYGSATERHTLWCNSSGTLAWAPKRAACTDGTTKFSVTNAGLVTATTFVATSDKRLKENIIPYSSEKSILDLPIYSYTFIDDETKKEHIGCLAQDLQTICPELVDTKEDGYLGIQESKIVYLLLDEVKKLKQKIIELETKLINS